MESLKFDTLNFDTLNFDKEEDKFHNLIPYIKGEIYNPNLNLNIIMP